MIHAICDFCGKDCDRTAFFLTVQPFKNFGRHRSDDDPYGSTGPKASFVICDECRTKHGIPNPYKESVRKLTPKAAYKSAFDKKE